MKDGSYNFSKKIEQSRTSVEEKKSQETKTSNDQPYEFTDPLEKKKQQQSLDVKQPEWVRKRRDYDELKEKRKTLTPPKKQIVEEKPSWAKPGKPSQLRGMQQTSSDERKSTDKKEVTKKEEPKVEKPSDENQQAPPPPPKDVPKDFFDGLQNTQPTVDRSGLFNEIQNIDTKKLKHVTKEMKTKNQKDKPVVEVKKPQPTRKGKSRITGK